MASYARQAKDESLRKQADRIQARAIRRCGELLKQIEPDKGGRPSKLRTAATLVLPEPKQLPRLDSPNANAKPH